MAENPKAAARCKKYRQSKIKKGLCVDCKEKAAPEHTRCKPCTDVHNNASKNRYMIGVAEGKYSGRGRGCNFVDIAGQVFGKIRAVTPTGERNKNRDVIWLVDCIKCGAQSKIAGTCLIQSNTTGCSGFPAYKNITKHRLYGQFKNMVARTTDNKRRGYDDYGGRGIKVYEGWHGDNVCSGAGFLAYVAYVEALPHVYEPGHTLDRWPNMNGNYAPGNVRWATLKEQAANQRPRIRNAEHNKIIAQKDFEIATLRAELEQRKELQNVQLAIS
jgi:hypothetical protein